MSRVRMPDEQATAADAVEQPNGGETPQDDASATRTQEVGRSLTREEEDAILEGNSDLLVGRRKDEDPLMKGEPEDPLYSLMDEESVETEPETEQVEEEETEEAPEEKPTEEEQEETTDKAPAKPDGRKRLNTNRRNADGEFVYSDRERAYMALSDEKGISLKEAERRLFGDNQEPVAKAEKSEEAAEPVKSIAELDSEIARLEAEAEKAAVSLDRVTERRLEKQIRELERKKDEARAADAAKDAARKSAEEASLAQTIKLYPGCDDVSTPFGLAVAQEVRRKESVNPDYFKDPEWSEELVAKVASRLGILRVDSESAAKAPEKPTAKPVAKQTQPARRRVLPSPAQGQTSAPTTRTTEQIRADIQTATANNDVEALNRLEAEINNRR